MVRVIQDANEKPMGRGKPDLDPSSSCGTEEQTIVDREFLFRGDYLVLERLTMALQGREFGFREIVHVPNAVAVLPLDEQGNVHAVRQYRPAIGKTLLEIPAGLVTEGESEEDAARRECEEETGYRPASLQRLITYAHAEGYSTGMITLYLGRPLIRTGHLKLDSTEHLEPATISFQELVHRVETNQILDSKTILSTLILRSMGI